ncbi:prolyl endopeptidase-like isoform X1 [Esox lucius]|uniref:prolyl endopeptidase-like isoform X1 n=2 Tax=Esox lucius TaxID=8010 RepID=UPI000577D61B|nr:prolyl endopeptidase-like isoform X1 [Esox lucius]XP_010887079.1 prolyl endopeptidase-like isoform X1 [Esox lucius]
MWSMTGLYSCLRVLIWRGKWSRDHCLFTYGRKARIFQTIACRYTVNTYSTTTEYSSQIRTYRSLERSFKKRLRAIYRRFSEVPDNTTFHGHNHVYFIEADGIYRMDTRKGDGLSAGDPEPEKVLCLASVGERGGSLQRVRLSPSEQVLAATVKSPHREEARCVLVRLGDGTRALDPPQPLLTVDKVFSFEWATDDILFYSSQQGLGCHRVFRLDLTSPGNSGTLVYHEQQPDVFVEVSLSRDRRLVLVNCSSKRSSEVWLIGSEAPLREPALVQARLPELLYFVEHSHGQLYILANTGPGQEYQVLKAPLLSPTMEHWDPVCTPGTGRAVKDMEVLQNHCVLATRDPSGLLGLQVVPLDQTDTMWSVQLPQWACAIETKRAGLTDSGWLEFLLSSPVHPPVLYCYSPRENNLLLQEEEREERRTPQDYHTTRLEAPSLDGTIVPLTVFHTSVLEELSCAPLLVHVYGAYGTDLNMDFSPDRRLLLEDGWALAYCHVRGGGELGLGWHRRGRMEGKLRGVEDLAACIHRLHDLGVSRPSLTALTARSAGAILAGALCNLHPRLIRAVTLQAPFLDVLGTMQEPGLPLTLEERGEWGDPLADPRHRDAIASYCPVHNITPQLYPSMLLTAYRGDSRVPLAGVMRYVERLREAIHTHLNGHPETESKPTPRVVLDLQTGADHFGPEDFELSLTESARQLAFLHTELGLNQQKTKNRRK